MPKRPPRPAPATAARTGLRWLLALAYAFVGFKHVTAPAGFIAITPDWVPDPALVVWMTGWCEMAGAIGLAVERRWLGWPQPAAAIGLATYAVCVFPANINHAINHIAIGGTRLGWGYHGPRLLAQPLLVWAPLWATALIDWPFRSKKRLKPEAY